MAKKPIKRPRDPVQLAKLIGDIATGQVQDLATMDNEEHTKLINTIRKNKKSKAHKPGKRGS